MNWMNGEGVPDTLLGLYGTPKTIERITMKIGTQLPPRFQTLTKKKY